MPCFKPNQLSKQSWIKFLKYILTQLTRLETSLHWLWFKNFWGMLGLQGLTPQ
jgi:hypothetical protein